nr:site-specific integrase [Bacteroidales bacterium]
MATVKVKFRPSKVEGKKGVIYYQIIHRRKTVHISTKYRIYSQDWDEETLAIFPHSRAFSALQHRVDAEFDLLKRIVWELDMSGKEYIVDEVKNRYFTAGKDHYLLEYMNTLATQMKSEKRYGSAVNYEKASRSFSKYLKFCHANVDVMPMPVFRQDDIPLSSVTEQVISGYAAYLSNRGLMRNSISFYMRILRTVYNKAVRQKLAPPTHAFYGVYTGIDRTRKRSVDESVIACLYRLDLPQGGSLAFARDLFIFSYCTRGMAFVDMAYLKRSDLYGGMIHYARRKTGQQLSVRIEPCMQCIIDRYCTNKLPSVANQSPYVFPIITSLNESEAYNQYQIALNKYNRQLKRLSAMLPHGQCLSSYVARHSWATAARNHEVPISVISAGMGHTTEHTTRIYLASLENSIIDDANKSIIDCLG